MSALESNQAVTTTSLVTNPLGLHLWRLLFVTITLFTTGLWLFCPLISIFAGTSVHSEFRDHRPVNHFTSNSLRASRALFRSSFLLTGSLHFAASAAMSLISSSTVNLFLIRKAVVAALTAAAASSSLSLNRSVHHTHLFVNQFGAEHKFLELVFFRPQIFGSSPSSLSLPSSFSSTSLRFWQSRGNGPRNEVLPCSGTTSQSVSPLVPSCNQVVPCRLEIPRPAKYDIHNLSSSFVQVFVTVQLNSFNSWSHRIFFS